MAIAKLDIVNTLPPRITALGISVNLFGRYVGLSSSEISQMLSGKKRISGPRVVGFKQMADDLELVARAFSPAPVNFSNVLIIKTLAEELKNGNLLVGVMNSGILKISGFDATKFGDF